MNASLIGRARGIFSALRSHEWWGYKLPPLLAVAYAAALRADYGLYELAPLLLFLLGALAVGAVYVSLLNDLTDLKEDLDSGKQNRMASLPAWQRYGLLMASLLAGAVFFYFIWGDTMSVIWYAASWVVFTLYSAAPFRLKKRGLLGVLADACGANLFPSLFLLFSVSHSMAVRVEPVWAVAVGLWSFCYGLRGILWHQFSDRENDLQVGLRTFATQIQPGRFKGAAVVLLVVELAALAVFLWLARTVFPSVFLLLYGVLLLVYRRIRNMTFLVVLPADHPSYHILMSSYYQLLLPVSLLLADALTHPRGGIILILHLMLFRGNILRLFKDLKRAFES